MHELFTTSKLHSAENKRGPFRPPFLLAYYMAKPVSLLFLIRQARMMDKAVCLLTLAVSLMSRNGDHQYLGLQK